MAKFWQRGENAHSGVGATGLIANNEIYHNTSLSDGDQMPFDAILVALFLMGMSDQDDITVLRVFAMHEAITPTITVPADSDPEDRGRYPFGRGPVYFQPRSKIVVRPNQKLFLQSVQKTWSSSTRVLYAYDALFVSRPTKG